MGGGMFILWIIGFIGIALLIGKLAAGSGLQLPGPPGVSREGAGVLRRGGSGRRDGGAEPLRLFS